MEIAGVASEAKPGYLYAIAVETVVPEPEAMPERLVGYPHVNAQLRVKLGAICADSVEGARKSLHKRYGTPLGSNRLFWLEASADPMRDEGDVLFKVSTALKVMTACGII